MMSQEPLSVHHPISSSSNPNPNPPRKKRNLPGNPDPDAEVVALSPKSLMATNRFECEICNKGFQRDQNLQLHRRGHNLPWKLKQRANKDQVRKKVYVCPEKTCVHNHPSRALGDLTGIKKHFSRKHGEKKWNCDKCSKKYAVQSDLKAHSKICGTREYKCHCGTLFSRKDSFITHRAFCEALNEQSARVITTFPEASRIPQFANYADGQKLRLPLWLDHTNNSQNEIISFQSKSSSSDHNLNPMQASHHRFPETASFVNDSNSNSTCSVVALNDHHMVDEEAVRRGPILSKLMMGLTRDFLGVGDAHHSQLWQHHHQFNAIGSTVNLQNQFGGGHFC